MERRSPAPRMTDEREVDHRDLLRRAITLATRSVETGGGPFGALVIRDSEVIASGRNRVTVTHDPTAHAEIEAIREACRVLGTHDLSGCEIIASAEPCPMCLGAIYWARLDVLWYAAPREGAAAEGFDDAWIYEELCRRPAKRRLRSAHVTIEDADEPFRTWLRNTDRIPY